MGVAGVGKTAVGEAVAKRLDWTFVDADDLHPPENIRKMSHGTALTDADRLPWLQRVHDAMVTHARAGRSAIIACSALKQAYRDLLLSGVDGAELVYLRGTPAVLERRLRQRPGHFFDPGLLGSQFQTLEEPREALVVDADRPLDEVVAEVLTALPRAAP
jgi:gluconokinase